MHFVSYSFAHFACFEALISCRRSDAHIYVPRSLVGKLRIYIKLPEREQKLIAFSSIKTTTCIDIWIALNLRKIKK